mgnify:CR=1 FL=1
MNMLERHSLARKKPNVFVHNIKTEYKRDEKRIFVICEGREDFGYYGQVIKRKYPEIAEIIGDKLELTDLYKRIDRLPDNISEDIIIELENNGKNEKIPFNDGEYASDADLAAPAIKWPDAVSGAMIIKFFILSDCIYKRTFRLIILMGL